MVRINWGMQGRLRREKVKSASAGVHLKTIKFNNKMGLQFFFQTKLINVFLLSIIHKNKIVHEPKKKLSRPWEHGVKAVFLLFNFPRKQNYYYTKFKY